MAKGGARKGAGRPKGSVSSPRLRDYFTPAQIEEFAIQLWKDKDTDPAIKKVLVEHFFQKPPTQIAGDKDNPIVLQITGMQVSKEGK